MTDVKTSGVLNAFMQFKRGLQWRFWTATLFSSVLILTGCPKNPSIQLTNASNEVGGTLGITGAGFSPNGEVKFTALNTPGHPTIESIGEVKASGTGSIQTAVPFHWGGIGGLPGCAQGSNSRQSVTISATDTATNSPTFATIDLVNCETTWSRSPA